MGKKLRMAYDKEGDVLDVSLGDPCQAISEEVEDDFFVRRHPDTGEIVGFSVLKSSNNTLVNPEIAETFIPLELMRGFLLNAKYAL